MCSIEVTNTLLARSVHQCILASYGGIFLYKACINWMSHIVMLLVSCTTCLHTAVQVWCFLVNRVPNCRAVINNRIYGFMKRLVSSSNALVLSAVTSDALFRSRIVRHWLKLLYIHVDGGWDCSNESSLITIRLVARPLLWLSCTLVYM